MPEQQNAKHETRDLDVPLVTWFALGLVVAVVVFFFATTALYRLFHREHPSPFAASRIELQPRIIAPPPQLQADPTMDLTTFHAGENAKLHTYAWIDKNAGIIRIPIERAMDLIAQRGLPTRGPGTQNGSGKTPEQMQQQKAAATASKGER